jgi:hypothetical protein
MVCGGPASAGIYLSLRLLQCATHPNRRDVQHHPPLCVSARANAGENNRQREYALLSPPFLLRTRQRLAGGQSSLRMILCAVGLVLLAARGAWAQATYAWPDESTPTFDDAQCVGIGSLLAGVTTYADAQAACETAGPTICDGLLYVCC